MKGSKKQAVSAIVELLKKEQDFGKAKEFKNQLLDMLGEQDRKETAEVPEGRKLNMCKEDNSIFMGDEAVKIFLNAAGTMNDVSSELKAFLDYVAGQKSRDSFVERLEEAVEEAKKNREWRHEYMTLLVRDQENVEKGREEGREEGIFGMISAFRDLNIPDSTILQKLQEKFFLTKEESQKYLSR